MLQPRSGNNQELKDSFELFVATSNQLVDAYQELEEQIVTLNAELTSANSGRLQELAEKECLLERMQGLLSLLPAGVVVLDGNGVVQDCNPVAEELLGKHLVGAAWVDIIRRAFAPRSDDGCEVSLHDGRRVGIATRAFINEPGQLVLLTDLTETRALQERLSRHQRLSAMGKMTASLAHQIRTPISTALLYASHIKDSQLSQEKQKDFAEKIIFQLQDLEQQVKDMLLYAKGGNANTEKIHIKDLLSNIHDSVECLVINSHSTIKYHDATDNAELVCNPAALQGAIKNLIVNAIQAVNKGAVISVTVNCVANDMLDIVVMDKGPGVSADLQEKVLEPFFTTRTSGTGLGLAVVQAVAKSHFGDLWLESEPGQYTKFGIRLPLKPKGDANE